MIVLSMGYKLPEAGDKGSVWFPALEDDIEQLNDHNHNGTNSQLISAGSLSTGSATAAAVDWVSQGGGLYRQLVTCPSGFTYDTSNISVRLASSGHVVYPNIEKVSSTTFYVYTNDNSAAFSILFK